MKPDVENITRQVNELSKEFVAPEMSGLRREVERRASFRRRRNGIAVGSLAVAALGVLYLIQVMNVSEVDVVVSQEPSISAAPPSTQPAAVQESGSAEASTTTLLLESSGDEFSGQWRLGALVDNGELAVFDTDPGVSISIKDGLATVVSEPCSFVFEISGPLAMTSLRDNPDSACDDVSPAARLRAEIENSSISASTTFVDGSEPESFLFVWDESGNLAAFSK